MSTAAKHYITTDEYLHRERNADFRSEYFRSEMFAMAGASANPNVIDSSWNLKSCQELEGKIMLDAIDSELVGDEVNDKGFFPKLEKLIESL